MLFPETTLIWSPSLYWDCTAKEAKYPTQATELKHGLKSGNSLWESCVRRILCYWPSCGKEERSVPGLEWKPWHLKLRCFKKRSIQEKWVLKIKSEPPLRQGNQSQSTQLQLTGISQQGPRRNAKQTEMMTSSHTDFKGTNTPRRGMLTLIQVHSRH